jgi:ribosomal protein S8E
MLESLVIDGDTDLSATTNINYIDGTPTTQYYTILNGFRKSAIITTAANSRSAAGAFASTDFLETVKLMGGAGINALDRSKITFLIDPLTNYKALTLIDVKTRDINSNATIESGVLTNIYGYPVKLTAQMAKQSTSRLTDTAGKVNFGTQASNLYGTLLAVRWDQWRLGWKRRMQLESLRIARADITEFVATLRVGMVQRDTEAAALTYKVGI